MSLTPDGRKNPRSDGRDMVGSDGRRGAGGAVALPLGFTRAALPDQFPQRSATWSIGAAGTWILLGTVSAIGSDKGTIARNYGASRGIIMRYNSSTQLELICRRSDGAQLSLTHTTVGLGAARRWFRWGPDGAGGTDIELGRGAGSTTDNIALALGTGTPAGTDASVLDQPGQPNRAVAGSGLLFLAFDSILAKDDIVNLTAAQLLALGGLQVAPQPDQALGAPVATIGESGGAAGTWSVTNGTTAGTHAAMTVAEVTE